MDSAPNSCRAYIVYHDGLFAQGMRSLLEWKLGIVSGSPLSFKQIK